jgi:hypothetical protein
MSFSVQAAQVVAVRELDLGIKQIDQVSLACPFGALEMNVRALACPFGALEMNRRSVTATL